MGSIVITNYMEIVEEFIIPFMHHMIINMTINNLLIVICSSDKVGLTRFHPMSHNDMGQKHDKAKLFE